MSRSGHLDSDQAIPDADYQDTVLLLQEEIARLENELRLRDEALGLGNEFGPGLASYENEREQALRDQQAEQKIAALNTEVRERDEAIALLFDELRAIEEAEGASLAVWDQVRHWIEEVERRLERTSAKEAPAETEQRAERLTEELEAERRRTDALRHAWDEDARQLRATIAELTDRTQAQARAASDQAAVEEENRRLRAQITEFSQQYLQIQLPSSSGHSTVSTGRGLASDLEAKCKELELQLDTERRRSEALRQSLEVERRTWDSRKQSAEGEIRRLREQLDELANQADVQARFALAALEEENRILRARLQDQSRDSILVTSSAQTQTQAANDSTPSSKGWSVVRTELRTVRASVDRTHEEIQNRMRKLEQLRNAHRRTPVSS